MVKKSSLSYYFSGAINSLKDTAAVIFTTEDNINVDAIKSNLLSSEECTRNGLDDNYQLSISFDSFKNAVELTENSYITLDNTEYQILQINHCNNGVTTILHLGD